MADSYRREAGHWPWREEEEDFWMSRLTELVHVDKAYNAISPVPTPRAQPENEPPAEAQGPVWDPQYFPETSYSNGGNNTFGPEILAKPEVFMKWAKEQDACLYTNGRVTYTAAEWAKESSKHVGLVRHNPKNEGFKYSCEFWTPMGALD